MAYYNVTVKINNGMLDGKITETIDAHGVNDAKETVQTRMQNRFQGTDIEVLGVLKVID